MCGLDRLVVLGDEFFDLLLVEELDQRRIECVFLVPEARPHRFVDLLDQLVRPRAVSGLDGVREVEELVTGFAVFTLELDDAGVS